MRRDASLLALLLLPPTALATWGCSSSSNAQTPGVSDAADAGSSTNDASALRDAGGADAGATHDGGHADGGIFDASIDAAPAPRTISVGILPDYDNAKSNTGGIAGFVTRTGVVPAAVSNYENITNGTFETSWAESFFDEAIAAGVHSVSISLATGDADVPAGPQGQIAAAVAYGVANGLTVQVRFGYEMNGNWSPSYHGGDPTIFKTTWGEVATAVHGAGGQMVWAPNIVAGGISAYATVLPDDTSTIDVVGLDFYHFNSTATDLAVGADEVDAAFATIDTIVEQLGKPFILTETAVSYFDDSGTWATATAAEVSEKQTWLNELVSPALLAKYPHYSGFFWFDYNKDESSEYRDFSISQQTIEATMFTEWVATNRGGLTLGL